MAQKRRGSQEEQAKLERITLMIPAELKAELDAEVEAGVRTFSDAVRQRLTGSIQRGAWADVEQQMTGDARAFGRMAALLANGLRADSKPSEKAQELKAAVGYFIDRMYVKAKPEIPAGEAGMVAGYLEIQLHNARQRTYENGAPRPLTSEQRALAEILSDMPVVQPKAAEHPREKE